MCLASLSLNIIPKRFTYVVTCYIVCSLYYLCIIAFYRYITLCLTILLLMDFGVILVIMDKDASGLVHIFR